MAKRMINMGSIEQFRTVVKNVQWMSQYQGKDEDGNPIMDRAAKAPTIKVVGTEKIHGTNAAVCFSNPDGFWVQSRKNIITPEKDNAGCAFAAEQNKDAWMKIIKALAAEYSINLDENIISIYFEWCGGNIQKNACVSGLDKMAIIFKHFKVSPIEPQTAEDGQETAVKWFETCKADCNDGIYDWIEDTEASIFNVHNFPTWEIEVDFERPDLAQNKMVELVNEMEHNSPVAKHFNKPENIGEGIVWTFVDERGNLQRWKSKGEKHANSKVKTLKAVDSVKEQAKVDFANEVCKPWRLEQGWQEVFGIENEKAEPEMKMMGAFLKWVMGDIIKEESDKMAAAGLEPKEVSNTVNKIARGWFQEQLNKGVGL